DSVLDLIVFVIVLREDTPQVFECWYYRQILTSDVEDGWRGWDVGAPLTDYLCFGDVDGQPHPAVSLHSCIHDSLEVLWSVSHKSAVICILQLKDPHSVQLGGCLQPPDVKEVAIQPIDHCHPAVVLNFLMEKQTHTHTHTHTHTRARARAGTHTRDDHSKKNKSRVVCVGVCVLCKRGSAGVWPVEAR